MMYVTVGRTRSSSVDDYTWLTGVAEWFLRGQTARYSNKADSNSHIDREEMHLQSTFTTAIVQKNSLIYIHHLRLSIMKQSTATSTSNSIAIERTQQDV